MSLRQIRKLKEARKEIGIPSSSESDDTPVPFLPRKSAFTRLGFNSGSSSSESSSSESDDEKISASLAQRAPHTDSLPSAKRTNKTSPGGVPKTAGRKTKQKPTQKLSESKFQSVLDESLKLEARMLNPSNELRRIFGRRAGRAASSSNSKRVIKRKHWLIEPDDEKWPLVVKDVFKMEICSDKSHRLVPEPDYESKLRILSRIIITHDIDALYHFVQINPFNPHGLIQLATVLITQRSEYETAYQLIRRALFSFQSCFIPSFHPDKSVILSVDSIFTSSLLRALMLYANLLAGQGCSRTSLEVMKLIYAMEGGMTNGCPISHILLHIDSMAIRAGEYDWLSKFLSTNQLYDVLPSSAIHFALAQFNRQAGGDSDETRISKTDIRIPMRSETSATTALARAFLVFPHIAKEIIGKDIDSVDRKINDPFLNKLVQAWVIKGNPSTLKANEKVYAWIQHLVANWTQIVISGITSAKNRKPDWLVNGYQNFTTAELQWGGSGYIEPASILESEAHVLEIYSDDGYVPPSSQPAPRLTHAVSLESNPVAAFFQTLLPWSNVDVTGTEAAPITATGMLQQLRAGLGIDRGTEEGIIRDAGDSGSEGGESHISSDSGDEIVMD